MKINAITPEQAISKYSAVNLRPRQTPSVPMQPDTVELSDSAQSFSQIIKTAKLLMQRDDGITAHAAAVTSQVQSGTYQVSGRDIAARMIRNIVNIDA